MTQPSTPDIAILNWLLKNASNFTFEAFSNLEDWKTKFDREKSNWTLPADRAIIGGFLSDRMAYAFAAGYQAALHKLDPSLPLDDLAALCVTEEGGGHPSAIQSTLKQDKDHWVLNGSKQFVTCAQEAQWLLVAASTGQSSDGRNQLKLVKLPHDTDGLRIELMESLNIVPDISHGKVFFDQVRVAESNIMDGDGYLGYVKPFRTLEDIHVFAAILGFLFRIGTQFNWPQSTQSQILMHLLTLRTLAQQPPLLPETHIALGGLLDQLESFVESLEPLWSNVDESTHAMWQRDKALLNIAASVRQKRLETAWRQFEG